MKIETSRRRNTCKHESAHAVASLSRGRRFNGIEVFEAGDERSVVIDGEIVGVSRGRFHPINDSLYSEEYADDTLIKMAGPAATRRLEHSSWSSLLLFGSGKSDYESAIEIWRDNIGRVGAMQVVEAFLRPAALLVTRCWPIILRVASALDERGFLSYAEVREIYLDS